MDGGAWWATVHGVEKELYTAQQLNNNNMYLTECKRLNKLINIKYQTHPGTQ